MKIAYFDVGAHDGSSSIPKASKNPDLCFYAFEPTPRMIDILKINSNGLSNYNIIEFAVSDYDGTSYFNESINDWGCSSLLEFSEKSFLEWNPERVNVNPIKIKVGVIRLDTFIERNNIDIIEYLKIDTQGNDIKVLDSLGKYKNIVKRGVMEASRKNDILYINQNSEEDSINWLHRNGFIVNNVELNDPWGNEVNIYFERDIKKDNQ